MAQGKVTASQLNLRDAPDGRAIGQLSRGALIHILRDVGEWLEIESGGQRGYVSARYVLREGSAVAIDVPAPAEASDISERDGVLYGPGGLAFGRRRNRGVYNPGTTSIADFIGVESGRLNDIPETRRRVMAAVSANEGKLEAINTYDDSFLSFGAFQWTLGQQGNPGELADLLDRIKRADAAAFQAYFGRHGLDVGPVRRGPGAGTAGAATAGAIGTGYLVLDGRELKAPADKAALSQDVWAYRFWRAGHAEAVRAAEIRHAAARIDAFYRVPRPQLQDRAIGDFVTSELGVAQLLDQHVNRPGHVVTTIAAAVASLLRTGASPNLANWTDEDERELLVAYLAARSGTSMTDSDKRAARIALAAERGELSVARHGFA